MTHTDRGDAVVSPTAFIAGPERLFCQALETAIERRFMVLGVATSLHDAERGLDRHQPRLSVLVVDPPFPDGSLQDVCVRLIGRHPMTSSLLLFRERRPLDLVVACQHGAQALFDTTITAEQLVNGLERLAGGEVVMQPEILQDMMRARAQQSNGSNGQPITPVQKRMLSLLSEGHTSKEIAQLMSVTTASVHHNLERASRKLGTRHRAEAVARALRLGIIT